MDRQSIQELLTHQDISPSLLNSVDAKRRLILPDLLNEAFYASLQQNEGRFARFAILLEDETFKSGPINKFSEPKPLNSKQLQSISVAFDSTNVCVVVDKPSSDSSSVEIIGVAARPVPALRLSTQYPPPIIVEAVDPGVISLEVGEIKVVFNKGEILRSNVQLIERLHFQSSLPSRAITPTRFGPHLNLGINEAVGLDEQMWDIHKQEYEELINNYWPRLFAGALESMIRKTIAKHHGGGYLFLRNGINSSYLMGGTWFREPSPQLTHWLSRALSIQGVLSLALRGKTVTTDLDSKWRESVQDWARELLHPTFRDSLVNLDLACAECVQLSETDGVIVLNHDFNVLGFGASIATLGQELPANWVEYLGTRGNRHKSMANAVASMDGSIGIVVSQDGGVTIFENHEGREKHFVILTL